MIPKPNLRIVLSDCSLIVVGDKDFKTVMSAINLAINLILDILNDFFSSTSAVSVSYIVQFIDNLKKYLLLLLLSGMLL